VQSVCLSQLNIIPSVPLDYTHFFHIGIYFQVAGKGNSVMCYGPVVPDGYACCYNPLGNTINFGLAAFKSGHGTDVKAFHDALMVSFDDMGKVMATGHQARAKL
jgi:carnitine O-acetyltransferase